MSPCLVNAGHHWGSGWHRSNSERHAHARVLESPDMDAICSPLHYPNRHSGGAYAANVLPASIRLHGKFYYAEEGTGTHLATADRGRVAGGVSCHVTRRCPATSSGAICWACFRMARRQWWINHWGAGRYRDETLVGEIAQLVRFAEHCLDRGYSSVSVNFQQPNLAC